MINIQAEGLGKKYNREWIYRSLNLTLNPRESWAITGPNGSGKSTLLQTLTGYTLPSEGQLTFSDQEKTIPADHYYHHLSVVAPYQELVEELTLAELLQFHFNFKNPIEGLTSDEMIRIMYLEKAKSKLIKHFSSGMKQRLKLGLAFFSESSVLFLDEPTSNLDHQAIDWYQAQLEKLIGKRMIIICSNQPYEYQLCEQQLNLMDYKPSYKSKK